MSVGSKSLVVDRGVALHKMIRLATLSTAGDGYLTFMGNEFGHPEWIDFPREGNGWSYKYARRQWSLCKSDNLRYKYLMNFDEDIIQLFRKSDMLAEKPELLASDEVKKVLVFKRGNFIFAFNFNPSESFCGYSFTAPEGQWRLALDSDEERYNGFNRLITGEKHCADPTMTVYLPSRCALVFEKSDGSSDC